MSSTNANSDLIDYPDGSGWKTRVNRPEFWRCYKVCSFVSYPFWFIWCSCRWGGDTGALMPECLKRLNKKRKLSRENERTARSGPAGKDPGTGNISQNRKKWQIRINRLWYMPQDKTEKRSRRREIRRYVVSECCCRNADLRTMFPEWTVIDDRSFPENTGPLFRWRMLFW